MSTIEITDHAGTTIGTVKGLWDGGHNDHLCALAGELGGRVEYDATTDEDWDTDSDGDPVCRTTTTVKLSVDGEEIGSGEAIGYYTHCRSGGERYSVWQDDDGPERSSDWERISNILAAAGVIAGASDLDACIEAPEEPADPAQDPAGEYVVLYHGWQQDWSVHGRYAKQEDADRAARIADRATTEANGNGAYGWGYAVAVIDEDGTEEVDGLRVKIQEEPEA